MNPEEIKRKTTQVFRDVLDNQSIELTSNTTAADIEGWDSLSHITLISAVENEFKIKFTLADIKQLKNVGQLLELVLRKNPAG